MTASPRRSAAPDEPSSGVGFFVSLRIALVAEIDDEQVIG